MQQLYSSSYPVKIIDSNKKQHGELLLNFLMFQSLLCIVILNYTQVIP